MNSQNNDKKLNLKQKIKRNKNYKNISFFFLFVA